MVVFVYCLHMDIAFNTQKEGRWLYRIGFVKGLLRLRSSEEGSIFEVASEDVFSDVVEVVVEVDPDLSSDIVHAFAEGVALGQVLLVLYHTAKETANGAVLF